MQIKVVVDARLLSTGNIRGIGFFIKNMMKNFLEIENDIKWFIVTNNRENFIKNLNIDLDKLNKVEILETKLPFGIAETLYFPYIISKYKPDLVWLPAGNGVFILRKQAKIILTLHDLIYLKYKYKKLSKQWFGALYRKIFSKLGLKQADLIHTFTYYVKEQLIKTYNLDENMIFITRQGLSTYCNENEYDTAVLNKFALQPKKYFYSITGTSPNKNLNTLLAAFHEFSKFNNDIKLVITGVQPKYKDKLRLKARLENRIILTGYIEDFQKCALMRNACSFVFLSTDEGFGQPPLEAIFNRVNKIILSDIPVLREIYGYFGNIVFVDPRDKIQIMNAMLNTLKIESSNQYKDEVIEHLRTEFDWRIIAEQFLNHVKKIIEK